MADIKQAAKWIREGKLVRRPIWDDGLVWKSDNYGAVSLEALNINVDAYQSDLLEVDDLLADDWEIAEERKEAHNGEDNG